MRITLTRLFLDFSQEFLIVKNRYPGFWHCFCHFRFVFLLIFHKIFSIVFTRFFFVWCAKRTARQGTHPPWVPANKADAGGTPRQKQPWQKLSIKTCEKLAQKTVANNKHHIKIRGTGLWKSKETCDKSTQSLVKAIRKGYPGVPREILKTQRGNTEKT